MIRKIKENDTISIMTLWMKGNFRANYFIEREFWLDKFNNIKKQFIHGETYVYIHENEIKGFISINAENRIDSISVKNEDIRKGIGKELLNYVKEKKNMILISVYEENVGGRIFLTSNGFKVKKIHENLETNKIEYIMEWINNE